MGGVCILKTMKSVSGCWHTHHYFSVTVCFPLINGFTCIIFNKQKLKLFGDVQCRQMFGSQKTLTFLGYIDHLRSHKDH